ncbi:hypothetical protein BKA66DRAFT_440408 [Pyrenochaeta sp. MPI-SDFR-AT-0127]|nr:hypothetical protein BKA66DRAFT_440408 [Pyrenochaeta sp. MPI-SDFR-AT-0127]
MSRFELLPAELQIEIFTYLQSSDIKAARAVSRKLRDNATPGLFRSIIACARYPAMGAFQKISLHSVYTNYIKEIIFDASIYEASLAQQERTYEHIQDKFEELRFGSYWAKRSRWKRYQALYQEQEDMKVSGVLLQTISRALEWMPNITSIVYSPHPHLIPVEAKDMRDLIPRSASSSSLFPSSHITNGYASSDHAFRHLIAAIYRSKYAGISELRVEAYQKGQPGTEFSLCMFDFPVADDFLAGKYLFQPLTSLQLNMVLSISGSCSAKQQLADLAKLLAAAKGLRHLAFHITHWKCSPSLMYGNIFADGRPIFPHLGLRTTWPKLQSLSLEGIYADEKDLKGLLERHRDTLRTLIIRKCTLCAGNWAEVVDEVIFHSLIVSVFILDCVNELDLHGADWMTFDTEEKTSWRYEGHLVDSQDGERNFIEPNPDKKSVYELRR